MSGTLFHRLRQLDLPADDYAVFGSGPLAVRNIIPACNDLDVLCRGEAFAAVRAIGVVKFLPAYGVTVISFLDDAITFGTRWGIGDFDVDELIDTAEIIDALPFVRMQHVVSYKTTRASPKDLLHLDALRASGYRT